MNQRGQYGSCAPASWSPRGYVGAGDDDKISKPPPAARRERTRIPVNIAIIGVGTIIGLASWPGVKKRTPLGLIAMGTSGSMVAVGLTELIFGGL